MNIEAQLPLPETIKTVDDVLQFHRAILSEGVCYHPEEDFFDYVNIDELDEFGEHSPAYTHEEAMLRNDLLDQAYEVCEAAGVDICAVGLDEYLYLVTGEWPSEDTETGTDGVAQDV